MCSHIYDTKPRVRLAQRERIHVQTVGQSGEDVCRCEAETATSTVFWKSDKVFVVKKIGDLVFDGAGAGASN